MHSCGHTSERILVLGGTKEAVWLAEQLSASVQVVYSLAGKTSAPILPKNCQVRSGGFGGTDGLIQHLRDNNYRAVIDATHPFAKNISRHAKEACFQEQVKFFAYQRPQWQAQEGDRWHYIPNKDNLLQVLDQDYKRALVTLGQRELDFFSALKTTTLWLRMIHPPETPHFLHHARCRHTILAKRPPYGFDFECALIHKYALECLVTRNSGGIRPAKLDAARSLNLPVLFLGTPPQAQQGTDLKQFLEEIQKIR